MKKKLDRNEILRTNNDPALISGRLNVQDFVAARQAEIHRLQAALDSAGPAKKRAFQTVPRTLRRRTASHDPKRVPRRLRARAIREMSTDQPSQSKKRRTHKNPSEEDSAVSIGAAELEILENVPADPPQLGKYASRQKDKVWLPTHVWHKKRAKLEQHWGFMVPVTPTQKQGRLTHRVGDQLGGALIWDTSYWGTIHVESQSMLDLQKVADSICRDSSLPLYLSGTKSWQGLLRNPKTGQGLGPALVQWLPGGLVLLVHPSFCLTVFELLCNFNIPKTKVFDLRFQLGSIDIVGSQALHSLTSCFLPADPTSAVAQAWKTLAGLANVDALPSQFVLTLPVRDPRLTFPPRKQRVVIPAEKMVKSLTALSQMKTQGAGPFCKEQRERCVENMASLPEIQLRREPGKPTEPADGDPSIPVTLYKLGNSRLRVVMPWKWVLPFWLSLSHLPNVHIGGLQQWQQLASERGYRFFPKDFPATPAGKDFSEQLAALSRDAYEKRPAGKRQSFAGEIGDPFKCDWSLLKTKATVPVFIKTWRKGAPRDNARIYAIPADTEQQWVQAASTNSHLPCPSSDYLIGFVTSGGFNFNDGMGTGVGYASATSGKCLVRDVGSDVARLADVFPTSLVTV